MLTTWRPRGSGIALLSLPAAALILNACVFGGEEKQRQPAAYTGPCVDVSGEALREADALVASANDVMVGNFQYWSESDSWEEAKRRNPQAAITLYDEALEAAPGHCQAVFGRAVASATQLTQDPKLDAFIRKVEGSDVDADFEVGSMAALMKKSPDQAAPTLMKLSANLGRVERPTLREVQDLIEQVVMPKLDATIASMETVMDYSMFAIRYAVDGDTVEIDRSEVGPGLAGLKVVKAYLTVIAGYEWEVAVGGTYDWVDTLSRLELEDFDRLRPAQKQALDHLTGLFAQSSPFSKVRTGWSAQVQGIPALLLEAVGDAQRGLQATIDEAGLPQGQEFDPWRAGGPGADVDTVDLRIAIEALERSKKYLTGEVPIAYDKGSRVLKVDFPRLFRIDGLQGLLPHFRILPYAQWNDTVRADTTWDESGYLTNSAQLEVFHALGLGSKTWGGYWDMYAQYSATWSSTGTVRYYGYNESISSRVIAEFEPVADDPCSFTYVKHFDMVGSPSDNGIQWTARTTTGTFRISLCRDAGGMAEFAILKVRVKGPIEFTDASGTTTLTLPQLMDVDSPAELAGKIVFRDPTFGGVFPELSNANIWEYVESLQNVEAREVRSCDYVLDENGFEEWKCTRSLPENPSDLDYFLFALYWGDDIL